MGGIDLSYVMYAQPSPLPKRMMERFRPLYEASLHKFYVDEIYGWIVVGPVRAMAVISGFFDKYLVDRLVTGIALVPRAIARERLAAYQNGLIQFYAAASALAVAMLLVALVLNLMAVLILVILLVIFMYIGSKIRPAMARGPLQVGKADGDV